MVPDDISSSIEEISFEPVSEPAEKFEDHSFEERRFDDRQFDNENIQIPNLDMIQSIKEPEIPVAPAFITEEKTGGGRSRKFRFPFGSLKNLLHLKMILFRLKGANSTGLYTAALKMKRPAPLGAAAAETISLNDIPVIEDIRL